MRGAEKINGMLSSLQKDWANREDLQKKSTNKSMTEMTEKSLEEEDAIKDIDEKTNTGLFDIKEIFTPDEIADINKTVKKLDMEIAGIAATASKAKFLDQGEEVLNYTIEESRKVIKKIENEVSKIIVENELKTINDGEGGRSLDEIYQDKINIAETEKKIGLFSNGNEQRLDDVELATGSRVVSTVSFFEPETVLNKMRISDSIFSPVLETYLEVFEDDEDLEEMLLPLTEYPVYAEDILKIF